MGQDLHPVLPGYLPGPILGAVVNDEDILLRMPRLQPGQQAAQVPGLVVGRDDDHRSLGSFHNRGDINQFASIISGLRRKNSGFFPGRLPARHVLPFCHARAAALANQEDAAAGAKSLYWAAGPGQLPGRRRSD